MPYPMSDLPYQLVNSDTMLAADLLAKVKTVDGAGSGLDADLWDGKHMADTSQDDIKDGTSYARLQKAKADAINGGTILSLNGVKFPATQSPSSDPNTLDDYEEGTWTPQLTLGGVEISTAGGSYNPANGGTYVKVGRRVRLKGLCYIATKGTATGVALITGLPFTRSSALIEYTAAYISAQNLTVTGLPVVAISMGASTITPYSAAVNSGATTQLTDTAFIGDTIVRIDIEYFV